MQVLMFYSTETNSTKGGVKPPPPPPPINHTLASSRTLARSGPDTTIQHRNDTSIKRCSLSLIKSFFFVRDWAGNKRANRMVYNRWNYTLMKDYYCYV